VRRQNGLDIYRPSTRIKQAMLEEEEEEEQAPLQQVW
jgi:hypothetical protein